MTSQEIKNWPAVQILGAVSIPKARILYKEGIFKAFDKRGHVLTLAGTEPKRRKGWNRVWDAETLRGKITMRGKCMACGGWLKVLVKSSEDLWNGSPD